MGYKYFLVIKFGDGYYIEEYSTKEQAIKESIQYNIDTAIIEGNLIKGNID